MGKSWYAYYLKSDAELARSYFVERGYSDIGEIEEAQNGENFQIGL